MIFKRTLLPFLAATMLDSANAAYRPKQGVFVLSNQLANEVGVYESLDDGSLSWVNSFFTGGVGYPDPTDERNLDDLGSSNSLHYHAWNGTQYLTVVNAGGPEGLSSISLMEIRPDSLHLEVLSNVPLEGIFPCSVTAYEDRVCAATCAGSVTMECFKITEDNELESHFMHDFEATLPPVDGRPNAVSPAFGPGNILFSGDGLQVGIIMKGDADLAASHNSSSDDAYSAPKAGFHSFPVTEEGYGEPSFIALPDESIPFAFAWRSGEEGTNNQIVLVANIAGESLDFPECDASVSCRSSVTSLLVEHDGETIANMSKVDEIPLDSVDACWIDYRFSHFYTGNFVSDTVSIGKVTRDGTLSMERNVPIGRGTVPNDVAHMGRKYNGDFFLYTENQGSFEVGVHKVIEGDSFQLHVMQGAPYPAGAAVGTSWAGLHGLATTLLSEEELYSMYGYDPEAIVDVDVGKRD